MFRLPVGRISASVYTSPHATPDLDPLPAILNTIGSARQSIHFAIYSFTLIPVADAIIAAHDRGVTIRGVCDTLSLTTKTSQIPRLVAAGIDIHKWGAAYRLMHDKVLITDPGSRNATVALGSWNFTSQAEKANTEVLLTAAGSQVARILAPTLVAQIETSYASGTSI